MNNATFLNNKIDAFINNELARVSKMADFKHLEVELIFDEESLEAKYDEFWSADTTTEVENEFQAEYDILERELFCGSGIDAMKAEMTDEYAYNEGWDSVEEWMQWVSEELEVAV